MQRPGDEELFAYLDGELQETERRDVEAWLEADPALRERLDAFAASGDLLRLAFEEVLEEPIPEALLAAARGELPATAGGAQILPFRPREKPDSATATAPPRWRSGLPFAAALAGLAVGGGAGFFAAAGFARHSEPQAIVATAATEAWLNNAAGYYKLYLSAGNKGLVDVSGSPDTRTALQTISQNLPAQVRLPNLKPWGLSFAGARLVVLGGRPAAQLVYTTANKAIGALNLIIGSTKQADIPPTFARRQAVNLLYWRHQGRAYILAGQTDIGYLWGIANDVAWQLDAI